MMRYRFAPYKNKTTCPSCGHRKRWSRYIDENGMLLDERWGRCDREISCTHFLNPNLYPPTENDLTDTKIELKPDDGTYNTLPFSVVEDSLTNQFNDNLSLYLIKLFGERAKESLKKYNVGYSNYFSSGATVFWQQSVDGEIRGGKIIKYDKNGKRIKNPYPKITWVHSKIKDYKLRQCLFAENLLNEYPNKDVCIVESEKSSILCNIHDKDEKYLWLSVCQLNGLNYEKLSVLERRNVIFFSDKGCKDIWENKLKKINPPFSYKMSNFVETCEELKEGQDIGDWVISQQKKLLNKNLAV